METRFRIPPAFVARVVAHRWRFVGFEMLLSTWRIPGVGSGPSESKLTEAILDYGLPLEGMEPGNYRMNMEEPPLRRAEPGSATSILTCSGM
jgi:hypothetical protein